MQENKDQKKLSSVFGYFSHIGVFTFLINMHKYVSNIYKKLPKDLHNLYQLLAKIPYNDYSSNYIKIWSQ